jgi:hypothetical protein
VSVALVASIVLTVWASWTPQADIVLSDYDSDANGDVTSNFSIPQGDVSFDSIITFTPLDWGVATDADVPDGTVVGELTTDVGLGLLNPCRRSEPSFGCWTASRLVGGFELGLAVWWLRSSVPRRSGQSMLPVAQLSERDVPGRHA